MLHVKPTLLLHIDSTPKPPLVKKCLENILNKVTKQEKTNLWCIELVFVSPSYIYKLNSTYLKHNYVTDILTFDYYRNMSFSKYSSEVQASLICCSEQIIKNANTYHRNCKEEHYRVFIHGLLHLAGYDDKTAKQKHVMQQKECFYLSLISSYGHP